jgi:5-dehydro-2-deoxygluconokinase
VGGFAGNVATGLARLGVPTAILSAVGDDPHGRYVRRWLADEGVDTTLLLVHPTLRTALAFYESWPPDRFPITLFRSPTAPDWEITSDQVPADALNRAGTLLVSGTGLARPASFETTRALVHGQAGSDGRAQRVVGQRVVLDLDWRPMAWDHAADFAERVRAMLADVDVIVGGDQEFAAAGLSPDELAGQGRLLVIVKHGPDGASVGTAAGFVDVPGLAIEVTTGLGAGDAFVAALVASLHQGLPPDEAVRRANAAGAIVASRPMCSPAMPRMSEIDDLLRHGHLTPAAQTEARAT